jgi:hypothetical protein
MEKSKGSYRPGDKVEESGEYICEICHSEGGVDAHVFNEGDEFPVCMNCGASTSWRKAPAKE